MADILVIGGGGFIGRHTIAALSQAGARVRAVDLRKPDDSQKTGAQWLIGDINDKDFASSAMRGCDSVVLLAGCSLPASANNNMAAEISSHVELSVKVAEIGLHENVGHFVFASSGGTVYGLDSEKPIAEDTPKTPRNAYGVSKLSIEHYLRLLKQLHGLNSVSLRFANPFGEGQNARGMQGFVAAAMEHAFSGSPLHIWGDGSVIRDFIYVGDVADAITAACRYNGYQTEINIGSGIGRSLLEVAKSVEKAADKPLQLVFEPGRNIDVAYNVLDISRASTELDWTPDTDFQKALNKTAQWWRKTIS